jgi:hypothetical protein
VADLERQGLRFRTFDVEVTGADVLADVRWNQRDLSHVAHVHGGFRFTPLSVGDDAVSGLYLQRVLGVRLPLAVSFVQTSPDSRLYQSTLGPLVLLIESDLATVDSGVRERTTYSVGAPAWLAPLLPWAERLLRRNAARLQAEDEPLRARRRVLRGWGYRFADDEEGASYRRSLDLDRENVRPPPVTEPVPPTELALDDGAREWRIGRDDHLGLRVVRDGDAVCVYPRMCLHEGASLDGCDVRAGGALRCPWHGRRAAPLALLALGGAREERRLPHHRLELAGARLRIEPGRC